MLKKQHTYLDLRNTIHNFKSARPKDRFDVVRGKYHLYKCSYCGIQGVRLQDKGHTILIVKQYSQKKFSKCNVMEQKRESNLKRWIRVLGTVFNHKELKDAPKSKPEYKDSSLVVGSIHPIKDITNSGVVIETKKGDVKLGNFEFESASKSKRTKFPVKKVEVVKVKSKRTKHPKKRSKRLKYNL